jgi:spermidine/putrescine transport system substrate-binding protein
VQRFEQENGCRVVIDTFDSNEVDVRQAEGGRRRATTCDVPQQLHGPSSCIEQGMLQPLSSATGSPTSSTSTRSTSKDRGGQGDALQRALHDRHDQRAGVPEEPRARRTSSRAGPMLERADLAGRMTMLNDMRETLGAALKFLGYSLNTHRRAPSWRRRATSSCAGRGTSRSSRTSSTRPGWLRRVPAGPRLQRRHPAGAGGERGHRVPGAARGHVAVVRRHGHPEGREAGRAGARLHQLPARPAVAAENTEYISYLCPNKDAAYAAQRGNAARTRRSFPREEVRAKCEVIEDLGEDNVKYTKVWDEVRAAR